MSSILSENHTIDNEVPFCIVFSRESKEALEREFLRSRISYYLEWQKQSFLERLLSGSGKHKRILCTVRINRADLKRAREAIRDIKDIKIRDYRDYHEPDEKKSRRGDPGTLRMERRDTDRSERAGY